MYPSTFRGRRGFSRFSRRGSRRRFSRRVEVRNFFHESVSTIPLDAVTVIDSNVVNTQLLCGTPTAAIVNYVNILSLTYQYLFDVVPIGTIDGGSVNPISNTAPALGIELECWNVDKIDETDVPVHSGDPYLSISELLLPTSGDNPLELPSRILHRRAQRFQSSNPAHLTEGGTLASGDWISVSATSNALLNPGAWAPTLVKRRARLDLDDVLVFHREFYGEAQTGTTGQLTELLFGVMTYTVTT